MTPRASARQASIDVLRAVAIALMVVVHFVENLSGWYGDATIVFAGVHQVWWLPTGFAAPIFTFLTGVSYRLWVGVLERRGLGQEAIAKGTVRRGLFLAGLGFAWLRVRSDSLVAPMLAHWATNSLAFVVAWVRWH